MTARKKKTPLRRALKVDSCLPAKVQDGIAAVEKAHRACFAEDIRGTFGDSLDLDAALQQDHQHENRWDYLLGHDPSEQIIAVEPHSAKQDQITTVINKRTAARQQLAAHLEPGARVARWIWVASGKVHFADTEKARRRLDQNGIEFAGGKVLAKHLPAGTTKKPGRGR
jgi:hypothetical protein